MLRALASSFVFTALLSTSAFAADKPLSPQQKQLLIKEVTAIFTNKCASCHDTATARKQEQTEDRLRAIKKVDYILDLPRVARSLVKGTNPNDSDLWYEVNENMPPKDSGIDRLSKKELQVIEMWIRQGAPVPAKGR